jgi:hypothetical protein
MVRRMFPGSLIFFLGIERSAIGQLQRGGFQMPSYDL